MDKAKRKAIIAGNWKMNKTPKEATALLNEITPLVKDADCEVIACVPYVDLAAAIEATAGTNVKIGAENCHWAASGAFTGEISTGMLKEIGVEYVVLGHSERRQYFGETDDSGSASATSPRRLSQDRSSSTSGTFPRKNSRTSLSLMSLYGLSAQARPLPPIRLRRFAPSSEHSSPSSTIRTLQTLLLSSTAAP